MKLKLAVAFIFFALGSATIIDWFMFWERNKQLALTDRSAFLDSYVKRFPGSLKPMFTAQFPLDTLIILSLFLIAGLIFVRQKQQPYTVLGVVSFLFAFWNLFTLMFPVRSIPFTEITLGRLLVRASHIALRNTNNGVKPILKFTEILRLLL